MKSLKEIETAAGSNYTLFYLAYRALGVGRHIARCLMGTNYDVWQTKKKWKREFLYDIDLAHPKTLNEKIQWLKLHDRQDFYTICADKYLARTFWLGHGGKESELVPLLFQTYDWRDITLENVPDVPCIIKCNSGNGQYVIVRDKSQLDFSVLRAKCKLWLHRNYYEASQEWQYKNIKNCIIIEQFLLDGNGHIPNDYKLHYINGELQFVYCSIDREGENYRSIYSPDWQRMDMEWVAKRDLKGMVGADIPPPSTFAEMLRIGNAIAEMFPYVRVDFYDVDGALYYGEITLYHGGGFDVFSPEHYDLFYGEKLRLPEAIANIRK